MTWSLVRKKGKFSQYSAFCIQRICIMPKLLINSFLKSFFIFLFGDFHTKSQHFLFPNPIWRIPWVLRKSIPEFLINYGARESKNCLEAARSDPGLTRLVNLNSPLALVRLLLRYCPPLNDNRTWPIPTSFSSVTCREYQCSFIESFIILTNYLFVQAFFCISIYQPKGLEFSGYKSLGSKDMPYYRVNILV